MKVLARENCRRRRVEVRVLRKPGCSTGNANHHSNIDGNVAGVYHKKRVHSNDNNGAPNRVEWKWNLSSVGPVAQSENQDNCQEGCRNIEDLGRCNIAKTHVGHNGRAIEVDPVLSARHRCPAESEEPESLVTESRDDFPADKILF